MPRLTTPRVLDLIHSQGARIIYEPLTGGRAGEYRWRTHTVALDLFLTPVQELSTAAHEAGHAHHRDRPTPGDVSVLEARADEYAARLLIDPAEYARAETLHGPHAGAIAVELDVSRWVVEAFQRALATGRAWTRAA